MADVNYPDCYHVDPRNPRAWDGPSPRSTRDVFIDDAMDTYKTSPMVEPDGELSQLMDLVVSTDRTLSDEQSDRFLELAKLGEGEVGSYLSKYFDNLDLDGNSFLSASEILTGMDNNPNAKYLYPALHSRDYIARFSSDEFGMESDISKKDVELLALNGAQDLDFLGSLSGVIRLKNDPVQYVGTALSYGSLAASFINPFVAIALGVTGIGLQGYSLYEGSVALGKQHDFLKEAT